MTIPKDSGNATNNTVNDTDMDNRYSRQTLTYGKNAMVKITKAKILVSCKSGFSGSALELAKCVIMAGVNTVDLHSRNFRLGYPDLSSNYYCGEEDVRISSVETESDPDSEFDPDSIFEKVRLNLAELNPSVTVKTICQDYALIADTIRAYDLVVFADYSVEEMEYFNRMCRSKGVKSIGIWTYGLMGSIFCDFLTHEVLDLDGNPAKSGVVQTIKDHIFTTAEPHGLNSGSVIKFGNRVMSIEMDKPYLVYVINSHQFQISPMNNSVPSDPLQRLVYAKSASTPKFNVIDQVVKNVTFEEVKIGIIRTHNSYESYMSTPQTIPEHLVRFDMMDWSRPVYLLCFHRALSICFDLGYRDMLSVFEKEIALCGEKLDPNNSKIFDLLYYTHTGRISGIDSIIGATAAQEVIKAVCQKYEPINQFLYLDALDILPDSYLESRKNTPEQYEDKQNRYDGQTRIFGNLPLPDQTVFVVGSGAVGCEHIKNLSMMGVGTGTGKVIVTDMDSIELSNLNRQFLFRSKDIGEPKSIIASRKAKVMNPQMKIEAHTRRVGKETENVYDQKFINSVDIVMNALDNVQARKYMDGRCVDSHTPLLECGTLGTIGSVQAVVPRVTESYSSFEDADQKDAIPVCTLKLFPSTFEHVVEYARSAFESHFNVPQSTYLKISKDPDCIDEMGPTDLVSTHRSVMTLIENCKNFKYCIRRAFNVFHQIFRDPISQLIQKYPEDHKTEDGDLFWSGSKIYPNVIHFDINNGQHIDFVIRFSHILADSLNIPQSKRYRVTDTRNFKRFVQTLSVPAEVKNEDVDLDEDDNESENENGSESENKDEIDTDLLRKQIRLMVEKSSQILGNIEPVEFEKDDDSNNHIDFMTVVSNLRALNYNIQPKDRLHVKGVSGKIIPAIATTTSIVSGLVALEFYKLVYAKTLPSDSEKKLYSNCERYRYGTFSLASSTFAFGDSVPPQVHKVGHKEYTIWTTDTFDATKELEEVIDHYCDIGCGEEDLDSDDESDSESESESESESLIENPLTVHSVYLDDEIVYDEFHPDFNSKTLKDVIKEYRVRGKRDNVDDNADENVDEGDENSRDYMFRVTMAPEDVTDDLDAVQESSVNIKFRVHL